MCNGCATGVHGIECCVLCVCAVCVGCCAVQWACNGCAMCVQEMRNGQVGHRVWCVLCVCVCVNVCCGCAMSVHRRLMRVHRGCDGGGARRVCNECAQGLHRVCGARRQCARGVQGVCDVCCECVLCAAVCAV